MVPNELSNEEKLAIYRDSKEHVRKASEYITAHLGHLTDNDKKEESYRIIHREIINILHYLDYIKSFGDKKEQEIIDRIQEAGARYSSLTTIEQFIDRRAEIAYWAAKANTIGLNPDKKPVRMFPINIDFTLLRILSPEFKLI